MSQTTETLATVPEQNGSAGASQNLPTDLAAAPGRAITVAMSQHADPTAVPAAVAAAAPQHPEPSAVPAAISAASARQAAAVGLVIQAEAQWPESALDLTPPSLPGFIVSSFSPIAAETASRCLSRRPPAVTAVTAATAVTAVLIVTDRGDRESAAHVARTVADAGLLGPLLFFQSVPNAVAGHIAARWQLTGPVVCLADPASALETAALLIDDRDADEVLLLRVEQGPDRAQAVLLQAAPGDLP